MSDAANITGLSHASAVVPVGEREESGRLPSDEALPEASDDFWQQAGAYPCQLSIDVPLERFTVRDLLRLKAGVVLESTNPSVNAVPVVVNRQTIGWAVFEVVGERLAVRMTELS